MCSLCPFSPGTPHLWDAFPGIIGIKRRWNPKVYVPWGSQKNDSGISLCSAPALEFWDSNPTGFTIRDRALFSFISHFPSLESMTLFSLTISGLDFPLSSPVIQTKALRLFLVLCFCFVVLYFYFFFFPGWILFTWMSEHFRGNSKWKDQKAEGEQQKGQRGLAEMKRRRWQMMTTRVCPQQRDTSVVLSRTRGRKQLCWEQTKQNGKKIDRGREREWEKKGRKAGAVSESCCEGAAAFPGLPFTDQALPWACCLPPIPELFPLQDKQLFSFPSHNSPLFTILGALSVLCPK